MLKNLFRRKLFWFATAIVVVYLINSSLLVPSRPSSPLLLAHRGLGQTFPMEGITGDTNTAARIYPPEHHYIENTIPSMEAAFAAGADIVELDIHPTTDGEFAVFHDWILYYRTDGKGETREFSMDQLRKLDVGYGYTADNGQTYPLRGQGVGLMPSLDEVLNHFPDKPFLIHIKSGDPREGVLLANYLRKYPPERRTQLTVYGGDAPITELKQKLPDLRVMSKATMVKGLLSYMAIGWTGYVPAVMRGSHFHVPLRFARFLWGWPHRLQERLDRVNSRLILVLGDGTWSEGFDTVEDLDQLPSGFRGGIWTNKIDRIGPKYSD